MDKESYFELIRQHLEAKELIVENKREINYGIQFEIVRGMQRGIFRIYEGKKGIRLDASQIRQDEFRASVDNAIKNLLMGVNLGNETKSFQDPKRLIGIDESGKGDYLVPWLAGVYTGENTSAELQYAGVTDSKKITDHKAQKLAN